MQKTSRCALVALCALAGTCAIASADSTPTWHFSNEPYLSRSDSLFTATSDSGFFLDDFEDGALNLTGVLASDGWVRGRGKKTDSVDLDDGVLDGRGRRGSMWFVPRSIGAVTFTFDADLLGGLPTFAGVVWTDGRASKPVTIEAYGPEGFSLGTMTLNLGDAFSRGQTAEDRFIGLTFAEGISAIRISAPGSRLELDHLQFGGVVPAPGAMALVGLAGLLGGRRRRRNA